MNTNKNPLVTNQSAESANKDFHLTRNKKIIMVVIFFLLFSGTLFVALVSNNQTSISPTPVPSRTPTITPFPLPTIPASKQVNKLQNTVPGQIIEKNTLEKHPQYITQNKLKDNSTEYTFKSEILSRPNQIILSSDSVVLFERTLMPSNPSSIGYTTINSLKNKYGNPDRVINGSKFYDWYIETHIYASKGFAFICNPDTKEVYEIHFFDPSSVEDYIQKYGEDLNPDAGPPVEGA